MIELRRVFTQVEDIFHEFGPVVAKPLRRGGAVAVIKNPFAGRYEANIAPFMEELKPLGLELAHRLIAALNTTADEIQGYGKAAIVGSAGELEHGALWHAPGGYGMREVLGWKAGAAAQASGQPGNALAIVPSTKKVGAPGATIDVPLTHLNASYVRSHLDAMEIRIPGAPAADETAYILVMSLGPRIHERLGGFRVEQIDRWDGQK
jgi:Amino acid synthesis